MKTVYAVRAGMVDGSEVDILLFEQREAAAEHVAYVLRHCPMLGYERITVMPRLIIGPEDRQPFEIEAALNSKLTAATTPLRRRTTDRTPAE